MVKERKDTLRLDEWFRCVHCNLKKNPEDWGKMVTTEYFQLDDKPWHSRKRMTCKTCLLEQQEEWNNRGGNSD
jgi:hypothetical protein